MSQRKGAVFLYNYYKVLRWVCLFVCLSVCLSTRTTRKLHRRTSPIFVHVACGGIGSVLLWLRCIMSHCHIMKPMSRINLSTTLCLEEICQVAIPVERQKSSVWSSSSECSIGGRGKVCYLRLTCWLCNAAMAQIYGAFTSEVNWTDLDRVSK